MWCQEIRQKIQALPEYNCDSILKEYQRLMRSASEMRGKTPKEKAFYLYNDFVDFAHAYNLVFTMVCHDRAPPVEEVEKILQVIHLKNTGFIDEAKARGLVMDLAEGFRRQREAAH